MSSNDCLMIQKPQNTNKNRVSYIDIARGIAIILMVVGHVLDHGLKRNIIFSFHMPLFIIVSGIFYKERSIKETIKNVLVKLILPYIICTFIVSFLTAIIYKTSIEYAFVEWIKQICFSYVFCGDINFGVSVTSLDVLWFFPLLAISKLFFTAIKKISKDNDIALFCISVFISYLGYILGIKKYWLPFSIDVAMASIIFYYVGYILTKKQLLDQILKNNKLFVIFLVFWIIGIKYNWIELAIRRYPNGLFSFITAISGTMVIFKISILIDRYLSNISKILCWYGKNSAYILIMHYVERRFINYDIFQSENLTIMKLKISCFKLVLITIATKLLEEILRLYKYIKKYFKNKNGGKNMEKYDYLVVGSGLFGSIFAHEANKKGKKCLVIDKRPNVAGNIYTENIDGINVHKYGAHIFHTSNKEVWEYINQFAEFNRYTNSPVARYKDELYNMPFNMNTFNKLWGVVTPAEAMAKIEEEKKEAGITEPKNLEEQAISLVGKTIYEKLVKGYTEKQWGKRATELPSFIIKRLPVRMIYDNNYFNDIYQGIPMGGYTKIIEKMLEGIEVRLNCDFFDNREELENIADKIIFTGPIDKYYNYKFGELEYRSLRFETEELDMENYQGNAVVNYTEYEVPYTRIIEHKHFEYGPSLGQVAEGKAKEKTIVTREYPDTWVQGKEPYYTMNDEKNTNLYAKYKELADKDNKVIFGGRLGQYKYFDMDKVILEALNLVKEEL